MHPTTFPRYPIPHDFRSRLMSSIRSGAFRPGRSSFATSRRSSSSTRQACSGSNSCVAARTAFHFMRAAPSALVQESLTPAGRPSFHPPLSPLPPPCTSMQDSLDMNTEAFIKVEVRFRVVLCCFVCWTCIHYGCCHPHGVVSSTPRTNSSCTLPLPSTRTFS